MQNLSCYNDYNSEVTCTWIEHSEAHAFLGMTLHRRCNNEINTEEMHCKPQAESEFHKAPKSYIHWLCRSTVNAFGIGINDFYSFKPNETLQAELNVPLFQNVQPLPPENLSVSLMRSGDFLLTWKVAAGNQGLGNALKYEVAYKQEWETWEKAASLSLSNTTHCYLSHEGLVPGSSYVARVRARPGQTSGFSGQYSKWSTEVSWETPEGGIQPKNLRCLFDGVDRLTCSWEVKKEIITSVLFGLFFRATSASVEEECSPVHEEILPHAPYVVQSCEITVTNTSSQSQYHVAVRTKTEEKLIEAYRNIKVLPPANVSVTMRENQEYELRWIKHTLQYSFIKQRYEVQYWKHNQYEKTLQRINISNDEPPFIFTLQMLGSSTRYRGKMRARVNTPLDYKGPWSEWSEEFTWETENVLSPVVLPVMLPAIIITLLIIAHCSYRYLLRKKKNWEEKIPNPSKSLLIQSYLQKVHPGNWLTSSQLDFNKHNLSEKMEQASFLQVVDRQMKILAESPEGQAEKAEASFIALDLQNLYHALDMPEHAPVVCPSSQIADPSFSISKANTADASIASQTAVPCFDFNGPYLYRPVMPSQPDMHQALQAVPAGIHGKSASLQYVTLPKEACPQPPQRQAQPGALPLQPLLLPDRKEMMQHLGGGEEISPAQPACGKCMNVRPERQKSPMALSRTGSAQQCSLSYITTDSLLLPSARHSNHLSLATDGELASDSQEIQPPDDCFCHEFSPGKSDALLAVSGQTPNPSPQLHLDAFGDYLTVPPSPHGPSESTNVSLPVLQKGNNLSKEQPLSEGNLVVLNPDSTEPVFLCEVGDYCFPGLKPSEKMHMSQEDTQVKKPSDGRTASGKPVSVDESTTGKEQNASKMQAIHLFKSLKLEDYFSWQQSSRLTEIC
ncbi:cytokine receptor common subunit beta isoform X2 [Struthio camelus]